MKKFYSKKFPSFSFALILSLLYIMLFFFNRMIFYLFIFFRISSLKYRVQREHNSILSYEFMQRFLCRQKLARYVKGL